MAIVGSCLTTSLMMAGGLYDETGKMIWYLRLHPTLNFCRVIYMLSDNCAWRDCTISFEYADAEIITCLKCLWMNSVVYMILALYCEEVMPQQFGIPKHPLFFIEPQVKRYLPFLYPLIFTDEASLASFKDESELVDEDPDAKTER
jgi:hypothetical protein